MNKKEDLKNYIQALQEQEKSQESKNGITLWGIGAGLIYIAWQIISKISNIQETPNSAEQLLELLSILTTVVACILFIASNYSSTSKSTFDYRFSPNTKHTTTSTSIAILLIPTIASTLAFAYAIETTEPKLFQKISGYSFLTLLLLFFLAEYSTTVNKSMPDVSSISAGEHGKTVKIFTLALTSLFTLLASVGAWKIIEGIFSKNYTEAQFETAFNLCLIPICIFIAKGIRDNERKSNNLNKLQRDIYIHDISTEEIEFRLKEEFIGFHFDERMQSEIDKIQIKIESFIEVAEQYAETRERISSIAPHLKYEIDGHKSEYRKKISDSFNSYNNLFDELKRWVDRALLSTKANDTYVKTKLTEIKDHLANSYMANSETLNRILKDLESL